MSKGHGFAFGLCCIRLEGDLLRNHLDESQRLFLNLTFPGWTTASWKGKLQKEDWAAFPGTGTPLILYVTLTCRVSPSVLTNEIYNTQPVSWSSLNIWIRYEILAQL